MSEVENHLLIYSFNYPVNRPIILISTSKLCICTRLLPWAKDSLSCRRYRGRRWGKSGGAYCCTPVLMNRLKFIERSNEARTISFLPIWPRQHGNRVKLSKFILFSGIKACGKSSNFTCTWNEEAHMEFHTASEIACGVLHCLDQIKLPVRKAPGIPAKNDSKPVLRDHSFF